VIFLCLSGTTLAESKQIGVLVLAHGGTPRWDALVKESVEEARLAFPVEVALGMGMSSDEVARIQQAVDRLEGEGVQRILVVPLLVSSHSSVYRQYQFLLGLREDPSWPDHPVEPIRVQATIQMGEALDASPLVGEILVERASGLSQDPAEEALVLVAHGPEGEEDNELWLSVMQALGAQAQRHGHFAAVAVATLRDDAVPEIQEEAARHLRSQIEYLSSLYRVLVIPLLVAQNGIEHKIAERLEGLSVVTSGETLLPHPNVARWIREEVEEALAP
jgi:sirohydrochlorin ferrochelatase